MHHKMDKGRLSLINNRLGAISRHTTSKAHTSGFLDNVCNKTAVLNVYISKRNR